MNKFEDLFEERFKEALEGFKEVNEKQFGILAPMMNQGFESMKEVFKMFYEQGIKDVTESTNTTGDKE